MPTLEPPAVTAPPSGPWPDQPTVHGFLAAPQPAPVPRMLPTAAAVAGIACAAAIPAGPAGLGWPVAFAVVALAVLVAGFRTPGAARALASWAARWETVAWAVAALALSAVVAVRAASWLATLCLLTAALAGVVAVAGRLVPGLARALVAVPFAALTAVPWIGRAARGSWRGRRSGIDLRLATSVLVGALLVLVFGGLLASADAVFAQVVDGIVPTLDANRVATWICLFAVGAVVLAGAGHLLAVPPTITGPRPRTTKLRTVDWAVPVGAVVVLFAVFVAVQFATLFGDGGYVQRTTGLTFAEYARGGFWQLLAVSVLALGLIMAGIRWAPAAGTTDRLVKRVLLGAMPLLCLVIVASALRRMWLYQQAYGFTVLRLLVEACELWLGAAFVLALVAVLRLRPSGTVRPMVATAVATLLALAVLDPERFIAQQNVARFAAGGDLDADYLSRLSADAVPALLELPPSDVRTCILATIAAATEADATDWRSSNLSRADTEATIGDLARFAPEPTYPDAWSIDEPRSDPTPTCGTAVS